MADWLAAGTSGLPLGLRLEVKDGTAKWEGNIGERIHIQHNVDKWRRKDSGSHEQRPTFRLEH